MDPMANLLGDEFVSLRLHYGKDGNVHPSEYARLWAAKISEMWTRFAERPSEN